MEHLLLQRNARLRPCCWTASRYIRALARAGMAQVRGLHKLGSSGPCLMSGPQAGWGRPGYSIEHSSSRIRGRGWPRLELEDRREGALLGRPGRRRVRVLSESPA